MQFDRLMPMIEGVPFILPADGRILHEFIIRERCHRILELGFAHGTGSCVMAAALEELGEGGLTSVDLLDAQAVFQPGIEEQLARTGLAAWVEIHRMQTGYTWFLHDEIRRRTRGNACTPVYDLVIIDGPKNWTIDGAAFFMVDKLLKPGGWIIFDDLDWTYAAADRRRGATDGIAHRDLSEAELQTPQVREIFELLVMPHPEYGEFRTHACGSWAWAHKVRRDTKVCAMTYTESGRDVLASLVYAVRRRLKAR